MQGSAIKDSQLSVNYHQETVEHEHHGHPDHRLFGLVLFLVAESSIFLGLFTAFLLYRTMLPVWPPAGTPELELTLPTINTIILVSSSFVMHNADTPIKKNDTEEGKAAFNFIGLEEL